MAVNAFRRTVIDYGEDPNNPARSIGRDLALRLGAFLVPVVGGGDTDPEQQFHGVGPKLQDFDGAANQVGNRILYTNGGNAEISSAVTSGVTGDPVRRMFADRLRRRSAQ